MPKTKVKNERELRIQEALWDIEYNKISKLQASKKYGVPRTTLIFRLSEKFTKSSKGPKTILSKEEEDALEEWIIDNLKKGFPRRMFDVQISVKQFLETNKRINPFKDNLPGIGWYKAFLRRHPNLSLRTSDSLSKASANVSENDIKQWFVNIEEYLKEENLIDIFNDPKRIFNMDEANFSFNIKNKEELDPLGSTSIYETNTGKEKENITVLFCFNANGDMVPPTIIFPYIMFPSKKSFNIPKNWGLDISENGCMKQENFYEFVYNIFNPFLEQNNIKKPIILFVDGHKGHLSYKLSVFCSNNGIVLISLYPNSTRLFQPTDITLFGPLKRYWDKELIEWKHQNLDKIFEKTNFALVLENVLKNQIKREILVIGFFNCGLCPWNFNNINFKKCLDHDNFKENSEILNEKKVEKTLNFKDFKNILGKNIYDEINKDEIIIDDKYKNCLQKILFYFNSNDYNNSNDSILREYESDETCFEGSNESLSF